MTDSPEVAIRRAAMPLCQKRHPDLMLTGFFTDGEFVAACADCQAEVRICTGCGALTTRDDFEGWRITDAVWCPKCAWLA